MKIDVLYEDNHLIAVYKPAGILTQGDISGDPNIMEMVKTYLKEKYHKPGNVFLGMVHRLDRPVSGVLLFAKTSKGAGRLSEQFRNHKVEKIYHAVVIGKPKQEKGTLINYLKKDEAKNITATFKEMIPGAKQAELFYETVSNHPPYSLLRVQTKTGKSHQIRAQLAAIGCPILGDVKYGAPSPLPDRNVALSATSISFQLATRPERKEISAAIPTDWRKYIKTKDYQPSKP